MTLGMLANRCAQAAKAPCVGLQDLVMVDAFVHGVMLPALECTIDKGAEQLHIDRDSHAGCPGGAQLRCAHCSAPLPDLAAAESIPEAGISIAHKGLPRGPRNFRCCATVSLGRATSPAFRNRLQGIIMKFTRTLGSLLLLAAFGTHANAQLTREQVNAELAQAIRNGDMPVGGESDLKLNQFYPDRYPARPAAVGKTREQVRAELAEAIRTGNVLADGESGRMRNEIDPDRYPGTPTYVAKTREQVRAELAEAIRTGDMPVGGESGLVLYEMYPQRYAAARASNYVGGQRLPSAAAAAASAVIAR
jgi:Domain of unknown function (DUF4148)